MATTVSKMNQGKTSFGSRHKRQQCSSFVYIQVGMYLNEIIIREKSVIMKMQCHSQVHSHEEYSAISMIFQGNETANVRPCACSKCDGW